MPVRARPSGETCHEETRKMRRAYVLLPALAPVLLAAIALAGPAEAASGVSVRTIPAKSIPYGASTVVRPLISTNGKVRVVSKRLTIRRDGRTIRTSVTKATLTAGTYRVTTSARYKVKRHGK